MDQKPDSEDSLRQEFEALGRNLVEAMRSAWESPETKRMREDVITGISDLGATLRREADNLANSNAAQQVRDGLEQAADKVRSPELQTKMRSEILGALKTMNTELQRVIDRMTQPGEEKSEAAEDTPAPAANDPAPAARQPSVGGDVSMGGEAVATESVPGLVDEDPYAGIVTPPRSPAETSLHPHMGNESVRADSALPGLADEDPFGKSVHAEEDETSE